MNWKSLLVGLAIASSARAQTFEKRWLSAQFFSEGANYGDFNNDGKMDVVAGPFIYEGPNFTLKRTCMEPKPIDPLQYSKAFFEYTADINGDGWTDIIVIGFPGEEATWYENPKDSKTERWAPHVMIKVVDNESPAMTNLVGDEKSELICMTEGKIGYAAPGSDPAQPWTFHAIGADPSFVKFTHGLGAGDVNGDGRIDLMEKTGWWEQPEKRDGDPQWKRHPFNFADFGGAQMFAYDIDGDGDNDVVTATHAHHYGIAWFENVKDGDKITFKKHPITAEKADEKINGVQFSQPHGMTLADMDGDGLTDLVTGKRYWAHGPSGDMEPNAPAVLYWFTLVRDGDKKTSGAAHFEPKQIDDNSGVGTMITAGDINGDKKPDVVVGNKKGQILFLSK